MTTRGVLLAVLGAVELAGCTISPLRTQELDCRNTPDCRVQVSVNCAATCAAAVDHDRVLSRRNGKIDWVLETPGYTFNRTNGIVFPSAPEKFPCHVEADGRRYSCDNNAGPGEYKYTVNLVGSPAVAPLDPWVVNN
jgi:hypothetical protein